MIKKDIKNNTNHTTEFQLSAEEYNQILNMQQQILEMLALNYPSSKILSELCYLAESLLPNSVASIMLKNKNNVLEVEVAPSIPNNAKSLLTNLTPGPYNGSCGNAVYKNEPQYVKNTFADSRWDNLKSLAIDFNICACWSTPIRNKNNQAIGTFALSSFEHRYPNDFHIKLMNAAATIVSIVLTNKELTKHHQLYSDMMDNSSDGMILTNDKNEIIQVNKAIENIYGYSQSELLGKNPKILSSNTMDEEFYQNMWQSLKSEHRWSGEIINKRKDGALVNQWVSITSLLDENKKVYNHLAIFTDLTELKYTQDKMEYLAYHDELTKLYNKSYLETVLKDKEEKTLILLNINSFSYINTSYGFDIGDEILKAVSKILKSNFTPNILCKINSDEFALVYNKKIDAKEKISKIQKYFLDNMIDIEEIKISITFSYGAVIGHENLLRKAATALKKAKEDGKNKYVIFDRANNLNYKKREKFIAYTNIIKNALDNNQVVPYFQGIYDNKNKSINKYEALVRIELEDRTITPYEFLEPAKLAGLIPDITKVVIEKAFIIMSSNNHTFSINITEDDLAEDYLVSFLDEKLKQYNINPNRVILEILEGVSSGGKNSHLKQLIELKEQGYKIAIDDFGAEYSNFERILDLDVDFLKIDAKYIKNIHTDKRSFEIAKAIAFFAKNVQIPCIAEFVHNDEVQNIVSELEIDFSQGYYFSEPKRELIS